MIFPEGIKYMKKTLLLTILLAAAVSLSACGQSNTAPISADDVVSTVSSASSTQATSYLSKIKDQLKKEVAGLPYVGSGASNVASSSSVSEQTVEQPKNMTSQAINPSTFTDLASQYSGAIVKTSAGNITLKLYSDKMPQTVNNFMNLAQLGFYDGVKFHRVIKNFMIQGGDPLTKDDSQSAIWGTGGPGYTIKDEFVSGLSNVRGTISMANIGQPDTGGSQFFINVNDNTFLNFDSPQRTGSHPVFGEVIQGMDVVDRIVNSTADANGRPETPIVIQSIELTK